MARQQAARDAALKILESQLGFIPAQIKMRKDLEKSEKNKAPGLGTKARLEYALKRFDIRVKPFLKLVRDITIQNAFITWIGASEEMAWREYQGDPPWLLRPVNVGEGSDAWIIHRKANDWITKGYRRLDSLQRQAAADMTSRVESATVTEHRKKALPESAGFTQRASWTRARLRERTFNGRPWNHNTPYGFGGPDRKTMKRILAGLPVHEGSIEKLLTALNKNEVGRPIELWDVPSD